MRARIAVIVSMATLEPLAGCATRAHDRAQPTLAPGAEFPRSSPAEQDRLASSGKPLLAGLASYYSDRLAGRPTASGEAYDPRAFTAAHRTLPFGSMLRVVRVSDGKTVLVRVNDRGPFGDDRRIIDLSRAAAEQLEMMRAGVVEVEVEVLSQGTPR